MEAGRGRCGLGVSPPQSGPPDSCRGPLRPIRRGEQPSAPLTARAPLSPAVPGRRSPGRGRRPGGGPLQFHQRAARSLRVQRQPQPGHDGGRGQRRPGPGAVHAGKVGRPGGGGASCDSGHTAHAQCRGFLTKESKVTCSLGGPRAGPCSPPQGPHAARSHPRRKSQGHGGAGGADWPGPGPQFGAPRPDRPRLSLRRRLLCLPSALSQTATRGSTRGHWGGIRRKSRVPLQVYFGGGSQGPMATLLNGVWGPSPPGDAQKGARLATQAQPLAPRPSRHVPSGCPCTCTRWSKADRFRIFVLSFHDEKC